MPQELIVIAENIHATRVVLSPERKGEKAVRLEEGGVAITYMSTEGTESLMRLPDEYLESQEYRDGKIKHIRIAIEKGMAGQSDGAEYLRSMAEAQIQASADYLDVNVDEISPDVEKQVEAMRWAARMLGQFSPIPLSIDSSRPLVIQAGLEVCDRSKGRPLVNSASLERPESLELAYEYDANVIISAFGTSGLPSGVEDRLGNIEAMIERAKSNGLTSERIFVDPLVLPVGTNSAAGEAFLLTVRRLRSKYGRDVHITGGLSNVSFGLPGRRLLNEVFFVLAVEAGCDSAIIDPTQIDVNRVAEVNRDSAAFHLAYNALTGKDEFCMEYVTAYREGRI